MLKKILCFCLIFCLSLPLGIAEELIPIVPLTQDEIEETPAGMHHYLLLCSDSWSGSSEDAPRNTDGIMLVTVDTIAHRVMLTSFIRDMLVMRPDGAYGRLNGIAKRFSIEEMMQTLNSHFGLDIQKYILVDWNNVANIIDALGGVDITVTNGESIRLRDKNAYKSDWTEPVLKGAGTYHFRGYAAVIYMRIRSDISVDGERYDYRRTTRARNVVSSLADSLREVDYNSAVQIATTVFNNITATNMTLKDFLDAAGYAFELRDADIEQFRIPIDGTGREFYYMEMATQQIDVPANRDALLEFLFESFVVRETVE
ncbi:MAG: LCP family protein [Clostridia bacterium]|nr:LCP family protein [Clostridia bacterium]MBR6786868.1 LCP family protein [Clostridia bacterium]